MRARTIGGVCFLIVAGLAVCIHEALLAEAQFIIVPSDPGSNNRSYRVESTTLEHAGHATYDVNGIFVRVFDGASRFHIFAPAAMPSQEEGIIHHCGQPLQTHVLAAEHNCSWAFNGGAFSTLPQEESPASNDPCDQGFVISDGVVIGQGEGFPEFAVTHAGEWVIGSFSVEQARALGVRESVNGRSWLVRDGANVAGEETAVRAHTAIGVDHDGVLVLVEVDGCEESGYGRTERGMADLLVELGVVHALDLDGGRDSTVVRAGLVVNHPTGLDHWEPAYESEVESIVCIA